MFIDTHCHIHESDYTLPVKEVLERAHTAGVEKILCVGTSNASSVAAVEFATKHTEVYAAVGVHPHDATEGYLEVERLVKGRREHITAVGEIGLDYFYNNSPRDAQIASFEAQLQLAHDAKLPVVFHVRDGSSPDKGQSVWSDFWPIFHNFPKVKGVLHSFTDTISTLETALGEGLYIGVNGISTFAKDKQAVWDAIPLEKIVLETDAPFLTPVRFRGKVNEPAFVRNVAEYHAARRGVELEKFALVTSANAKALFSF